LTKYTLVTTLMFGLLGQIHIESRCVTFCVCGVFDMFGRVHSRILV